MIIYTYQVSQIPPLSDELNDKICQVEKSLNDLIVECAGNFRALEKLSEIIDDALDTCNLNHAQIEIVLDEAKEKEHGIT